MACRPKLVRLAGLALLAVVPALAASGGSSAALLVGQARASYRAGDHFGAVAQAAAALAAHPMDAGALEFEAQVVRDSRGVVAALPLFRQALKRAPRNVDLLCEYAATLGEAGRNREMLAVVRRVVELDPDNPRALFLQAVLAARTGHDELARRLLWKARADGDPAPAALLLDGVLELRSGSPAQAIERLDELVRRQPDNAGAQLLMGRALLANGEANEVTARLAPLADRGDASTYLLTLVGRAYEELGERDRAALYLDRAARPMPAGAWALPVTEGPAGDVPGPRAAVLTLRALAAQGRVGEATALAAHLAARYPGSADVARVVGDVQLLAGRVSEALASYRRAATVRSDATLVQRMAMLEHMTGDASGASALLSERLLLNPGERSTAVLLAQLEGTRHDWPAAASVLDYAAQNGNDDPRLLADLAQAHLALGDRAAALAAARRAHAGQRGNGAVARALALALGAAEGSNASAPADGPPAGERLLAQR